eukprot:TRINITY_DN194_c0_g2_i1.p1 TRINITY_DN194_c0_g2~~TRINITY_DN194_c0_g2_i1.p1  ORF type:complete len:431 (+),score=100.34 TRINITY_DN194_c0_g2_i1:62-1294(+)
MKALFFVALASVAAAQVNINTKYGTAADGVCTAADGYTFLGFRGTTAAYTAPNSFPIAEGTNCAIAAGEAVVIQCADGYQAVGTPTGIEASAPNAAVNGSNATDGTVVTALPTGFVADSDVAGTDLTCQLIGCNYTCTTTNRNGTTGNGCTAASGTAAASSNFSDVCATGYYPVNGTMCPADGLTTTTAVVCSNDPTVCATFGGDYATCVAALGGAFSLPGACSCFDGDAITCPAENTNSPTCQNCVLACTLAPVAAARQVPYTASSGAICPDSVDTLTEATDCFEQAACAGAINPDTDVCVFGGSADCNQGPCPECPSSSKKGLLGLLGLLGLIPLLLCSLLCSLLLCCIRRRKVERDVHFATFDAGAPAVAAPMCADIPVATHHQTVHHSTFVGPEHMHGMPVGPTAY